MKKKLFIMLSAFMLFFLVSCNFNKVTDSEVIAKGYDVIVHFDANGGTIENYKIRNFYCKKDSYIFAPGENGIAAPVLQDFVCVGWHRGIKNDDGVVTLGDEFDFETEKVTESMTLYAKWGNYYTYTILDSANDEFISSVKTDNKDEPIAMPSKAPTKSGYTFLQYYADKECTTVFDWTKTHEYNDKQNVNVYAGWLEGRYIVASKASDLKTINNNTNIYLLNDIDCTGQTITMNATEYSGTIIGNGYTISNMTIEYKQVGVGSVNFALFRKIDGATMSNVTFDRIKLSVKVGAGTNVYIGVFATEIKNATLTNVAITNSTMTVTKDNAFGGNINKSILYSSIVATDVTTLTGSNNNIEEK